MIAHFQAAGMRFLKGLARHNDRDWFNERKAVYEAELKQPMLDVIAAINQEMEAFAPHHVRPAQRCMMRIYRDTRFSKEKIPYKTHLAAWWAREGLEKTSGGGFYLQVGPDGVLVAGGAYMPEREQLLAIRRHLVEHHREYREIVEGRALLKLLHPFDGAGLSRLPKGFAETAGTPAEPLVLQRQWGVSATLPPETALSEQLVSQVVKRFRLAAPLVDLLNQPLTGRRPVPLL